MANVLIRDVPDEVVNQFKSIAKKHNRSLQQELKAVLENTVSRSSSDIFRKAAEIRKRLRKKNILFSDSVQLLRKDRAR
jgi:plasmid stability protein